MQYLLYKRTRTSSPVERTIPVLVLHLNEVDAEGKYKLLASFKTIFVDRLLPP